VCRRWCGEGVVRAYAAEQRQAPRPGEWLLAMIVGACRCFVLCVVMPGVDDVQARNQVESSPQRDLYRQPCSSVCRHVIVAGHVVRLSQQSRVVTGRCAMPPQARSPVVSASVRSQRSHEARNGACGAARSAQCACASAVRRVRCVQKETTQKMRGVRGVG